tara:strand:- start:340 stop:789 length:450 start_codon:yes stop_codon:yes gene_type:complete
MYMSKGYTSSDHPARKGSSWGGAMPRTLRVALYLRAGMKCEACGFQSITLRRGCNLSLDHIVPLAQNGAVSDPRNLVVLCRRCNSSKGATKLALWLKAGGHSKLGLARKPRPTNRVLRAQAARSLTRHLNVAAALVSDENRARRSRRAA